MSRFRRGIVADAAAITILTHAAYAAWVPVIGREPMPMTVDYAVAVQDHRIDLLHRDGVLVALIEMVPMQYHLWVENVAVALDVRGVGFGRVLIDHAEAVARDLGLAEIRLLTNADFAANLAFYQHLGFLEDRREPFRGGETVYFRKLLTKMGESPILQGDQPARRPVV